MEQKLRQLKSLLMEADDLKSVSALLYWDQTTYMPPGGTQARARQMATLAGLAHDKFIDPAIGRLLDELRPYEESLPFDADDASLIRVTRREYERAVRIPADFMAAFSRHTAETYGVWAEARPQNDFARVQPFLEKTLDLSRKMANFFPGYENIADPLIAFEDFGMKASTLRALFTDLRGHLIPLVDRITAQPPADDSCLKQAFPPDKQVEFALGVARRFGFDFNRGRQDFSPHPYMTRFSSGDIRITTRVNPNDLMDALFGTLHEAGHAMYEQGISRDYEGTPLAASPSAGVHESQSRMWENLVGRSRGFWRYFYPRLQQVFPDQLGSVSEETFYRAVNKVKRSLLRTEADEVTYNLHVIIRFELELDLLEGNLAVRDLPQVWRERYQNDLGVAPADDRDGVLQDVHWYDGKIGGQFQGYTIGNLMAGQFLAAAERAHPEIQDELVAGVFTTLHNWLLENIYQHGAKFTADQLVERVTGSPLTAEPYIGRLKQKYGELYGF